MVAIQALADQHWHALPAEEVVDLLETDMEQGLDLFAVKHRQEQFGPNLITQRSGPEVTLIYNGNDFDSRVTTPWSAAP